jgi:hypothetical protein
LVDVVAFDGLIARGDLPSLEQAAALYRGALLEGWTEESNVVRREPAAVGSHSDRPS